VPARGGGARHGSHRSPRDAAAARMTGAASRPWEQPRQPHGGQAAQGAQQPRRQRRARAAQRRHAQVRAAAAALQPRFRGGRPVRMAGRGAQVAVHAQPDLRARAGPGVPIPWQSLGRQFPHPVQLATSRHSLTPWHVRGRGMACVRLLVTCRAHARCHAHKPHSPRPCVLVTSGRVGPRRWAALPYASARGLLTVGTSGSWAAQQGGLATGTTITPHTADERARLRQVDAAAVHLGRARHARSAVERGLNGRQRVAGAPGWYHARSRQRVLVRGQGWDRSGERWRVPR